MPPGNEPKKAPKSRGSDAQVYLVHGEDEFRVTTKARSIVDALCPKEEQTLGVEWIDAQAETVADAVAAISRCLESIRTVGFMGGRKVVWFKDANCFADSIPARSSTVKEWVQSLAEEMKTGLPAEQYLVVSTPKIDRRSQFYKACKARGETHEFALSSKPHEAKREAQAWAARVFKRYGLRVGNEALSMFLEKTGGDSRQIVQEVEKLSVYLGERKEVEGADVTAVVSHTRETAGWDLDDAFGRRDLESALAVVRQLMFQRENAVGLMFRFENRIRDLLAFRAALDRGWLTVHRSGHRTQLEWSAAPAAEAALSALERDPRKNHPYRAGLLALQAQRFSQEELRRCHAEVTRTHERLVSSGLPAELLLDLMLVRMIRKAN